MAESPTHSGGQPKVKEIPYEAPQGPSGINNPQTPGLHGENHGNCGTQGGGRKG